MPNGDQDAAEVYASLIDTSVTALDGDLTLNSLASQKINSIVIAGSVAIGVGLGVGVGAAGSGVFAENKIGADVKSDIDGARDQEICEELANMQEEFDYPQFIKCTTGKNQREKIIKAIRKLSYSLRITMSVQSLDKQVLTNIRRSNISVDQVLDL